MICTTCRRTLFSRLRSFQIQPPTSASSGLRYASIVPATRNAAPVQAPPSIAIEGANPAQSSNTSGTSQPLSEPHTPSTSTAKRSPAKEIKSSTKPKSSVAGGQELRGLGYTKAKPRVLAMEDDEYPEWLWTLLDQKKMGTAEEKVDLSGKMFPRAPREVVISRSACL